jgi:hypothetical protein
MKVENERGKATEGTRPRKPEQRANLHLYDLRMMETVSVTWRRMVESTASSLPDAVSGRCMINMNVKIMIGRYYGVAGNNRRHRTMNLLTYSLPTYFLSCGIVLLVYVMSVQKIGKKYIHFCC